MRRQLPLPSFLAIGLLTGLTLCAVSAEPAPAPAPKPAAPGTLVVVDSAGKEQKLKSWKFTAGTTRLAWLAPPSKDKKDKKNKKAEDSPETGPEALVLREQSEINFTQGVLTFIPLDRLRSLDYNNENRTVTARVAVGPKEADDQFPTGTTGWVGINKLTIEAEVDKGDAGLAEVTYLGGSQKGGIRAVRFPAPKVAAPKAGRPVTIRTADKDVKQSHQVTDLQALYAFGESGRQVLSPYLMFKKTLKVDLGKVKKIVSLTEGEGDTVWQVTQGDEESSLTPLPGMPIGGQPAQLVGLLGRAPTGYKLIPIRRVVEIQFDEAEAPKEKKDKEKAKDDK